MFDLSFPLYSIHGHNIGYNSESHCCQIVDSLLHSVYSKIIVIYICIYTGWYIDVDNMLVYFVFWEYCVYAMVRMWRGASCGWSSNTVYERKVYWATIYTHIVCFILLQQYGPIFLVLFIILTIVLPHTSDIDIALFYILLYMSTEDLDDVDDYFFILFFSSQSTYFFF